MRRVAGIPRWNEHGEVVPVECIIDPSRQANSLRPRSGASHRNQYPGASGAFTCGEAIPGLTSRGYSPTRKFGAISPAHTGMSSQREHRDVHRPTLDTLCLLWSEYLHVPKDESY